MNEVKLDIKNSPLPALALNEEEHARLIKKIIEDSESLFREFARSVKGAVRQDIEANQLKE